MRAKPLQMGLVSLLWTLERPFTLLPCEGMARRQLSTNHYAGLHQTPNLLTP